MKSPHKRYSRTITCTDEEWDPIQADANRRGKSASEWFVECALTEEVTPKQAAPRKLVLDAKAQRSLSRDVAEFARGSHADGDGTSRFADNLHALFETPLRTMAREGRREEAVKALHAVLDEKRAAVVAAAFIPEMPTMPGPPEKPASTKRETTIRRQLRKEIESSVQYHLQFGDGSGEV